MKLFHGTDKGAAASIKQNGFKAGECSDYGIAVYFSDKVEWAQEYAHKEGIVIEALFIGNLLDLSKPEHFEVYRKTGNSIPRQYHALKDGHIIAVYDTSKLVVNF